MDLIPYITCMDKEKEMAMSWNTKDELVGRTVAIYTGIGDTELATVLAVSDTGYSIKVRTEDDDILVGNQWDDI